MIQKVNDDMIIKALANMLGMNEEVIRDKLKEVREEQEEEKD